LGDTRIVVDIFGDGAINRGPFLEGINWAVVFKLPILFVCEDNQYSATTRTASMTAGEGAAARAASLGMRATTVDGNDVEAIADTVADIAARLRAGGPPEFLHAKTYRRTGHTSFDPATYRPANESTEEEKKNDPIKRQRAVLVAAGMSEVNLQSLHENAQKEMIDVLKKAADTPFPASETAFQDVQDIGSPAVEAY